jgi:hypothetical protein
MLAQTIFLLATAALLCNVNTSAQPVQLKHVGWFDLKERLPETFQREQFKVRGFVAHDMGLYFLVVKKSSEQESMLVHTDGSGGLLKTIPLPVDEASLNRSILNINVDENGNCYVLQTIKDKSLRRRVEFCVYDRTGITKKTLPVAEPVMAFCLQGKALWYISGSYELKQMLASEATYTKRFERPQFKNIGDIFGKMVLLPGNKLAMVDGVAARLYVIDQGSGDTQVLSLLQLPEVKRSWESYPPETRGPMTTNAGQGPLYGRAMIITGVSATSQGDIYLIIAGISYDEGAVVLQLDQQGNLKHSLRCVLPKVENRRSSDNPEGYAGAFPSIGATDTSLFLVGADGDVLSYQR